MIPIQKGRFYHICKYPEYDLKINKQENTTAIKRNWKHSHPNKLKAEELFEEFRQTNYPELPSRRTCFYVSLHDCVERWLKNN